MDEYTHLSLVLHRAVTDAFDALKARVAVPAPMPEDWR